MSVHLTESFLTALHVVRLHKLRSALTSLGIIIGVTTVTSMMMVVKGLERGFDDFLGSFGPDVVYIEKLPRMLDPGEEWWRLVSRPPLTADLAEALAERSRHVEAVTAVVEASAGVRRGGVVLKDVAVTGVGVAYVRVHPVDVEEGRFFTETEARGARAVCVLSHAAAAELFPAGSPLGRPVRVRGERFRVVGVLEAGMGEAEHEARAFVPLSTFGRVFGMHQRSVSIQARATSLDAVGRAADEATGIVRAARHLDAMEDDDFEVILRDDMKAEIAPVRVALFGVGLFLTALSLLVGGLGVMNIMFVAVRERTREIGLRKAVGATSKAILAQFLAEAVLICLIGGVLGVALALAVRLAIDAVIPVPLSPSILGIALLVCVGVGVLSGLAPAWAAARAEPIEALRYE
jgi:putative ABC transport system permease protein